MTDKANRPPSVETLLSHDGLMDLIDKLGRPVITDFVRMEIDALRKRLKSGEVWPDAVEIIEGVKRLVAHVQRQFPQRVVNATGVLIHTNLGRAPYGQLMLDALNERLGGYLSLEYDLGKGERGKRAVAVEAELAALAQTEAAMVVNNNAAAVYLVLSGLAWGKEVVISRGELVQIGGGFRIPEILERSGAELREIGTTNKTTLKDYEAACTPATALILKVHRSNFVQTGFVAEVEPRELAALGKKHGVPVLWDLGSGAVGPGATCEYTAEPTLRAAMATGVDLVTCSGDKLLGGPQAGIILGRRDLIDQLRSDPFFRALRPDKATLLSLEFAVGAHRAGRASELLPLYAMASETSDSLKARAENLADIAKKAGWSVKVVETADTFGGGAAPDRTLQGWGIAIDGHGKPDDLAARARLFDPPIVGTIAEGTLVFALRTVQGRDEEALTVFLKAGPK